ncbi:amino acid adenylation domain-containing protein [Ancylothrix sp. C2]|uniref:non-ribosomal peptide synthetase n=1 Tax=Ancylothrix sp. D3o TaxID=2953691 RepID=UPI0021BA8F2A|nr:non-ribosomal peptide synthetase [Ancylothrix sp. D3o]MCT7951052.1 amino acid adenylation domain-containing protein [Ancylothrix sp. D3o]
MQPESQNFNLNSTTFNQILVESTKLKQYRIDVCIHQLIEATALGNPDAIAVIFGQEKLTYQELNKKANQLAHHLQKLGAGPEFLVGICVERSLEMIIGVLGILKAGAAYVPLDPTYPKDRLTFILGNTKARIVLTQQHLLNIENCAGIYEKQGAEIICLDTDWPVISQESEETPISAVKPENLAYIIHTSGSTGTPKGVQIMHQGVCNLAAAQIQIFNIQPQDKILQFASLSFDASVWEIIMALVPGATLILAKQESLLPGRAFLQLLQELKITTLTIPPSILTLLPPEELPLLKTIIVAGEACPPNLVSRWANNRRFFNAYGPTEITVCATVFECSTNTDTPAIGQPILNTEIYILDSNLQPVEEGFAGEMYIGSAGVARGYLNQPSLTAERFIPNFLKSPNNDFPILYKTGDIVRYLPDGNIEYVGRSDYQVKIRGFRIEPGEIEAIINQHPAVQTSVVTAPEKSRLVAYILPKSNYQLPQENEQISQWQSLYEQTYSQTSTEIDPRYNFSNWNSSYTGLAIPENEMLKWVESTTDRILSLKPNRVLEIGCGTGLLLLRIAPQCSYYHGLDFSQQAINYLQEQINTKFFLPQVKLSQGDAANLQNFEPKSFDTIIINSVIQYFPNIDYLNSIIKNALSLLKAGGNLFVGDVRNYELLEAFHASIQINNAPANLKREQLKQRIQNQVKQEEELLISPSFFAQLPQNFPEIGSLEIQLKRGEFQNELTKFRYDVILRTSQNSEFSPQIENLPSPISLEQLQEYLQQNQTENFTICQIPDARTFREIQILEWLNSNSCETMGEFLSRQVEKTGIDPEKLWQLGEQLSYDITLTLSHTPGYFDATFKNLNPSAQNSLNDSHINLEKDANSLQSNSPIIAGNFPENTIYANNPLKTKLNRQLIPLLREFLQQKLPPYQVPNAYVLLETLPLTPNGKIDRAALPSLPENLRDENSFVAPRTPLEKSIADIWAEVFGVEQIGIHEHFLELGGHSLLATQILTRVRETLNVQLPLKAFFDTGTIAELAKQIVTFPQLSPGKILSPITNHQSPIPLYFGQEQIWFLSQVYPDLPLYNQPFTISIPGIIDVPALQLALDKIIERHQILRTNFDVVDGEPVQVIQPTFVWPLSVINLENYPENQREAELLKQATLEAKQKFDLRKTPLVRGTLYIVGKNDNRLVLTIHHIIFDGFSLYDVMLRELAALYEAYKTGQRSPLPELPVQYADFCAYSRRVNQSDKLKPQTEFWQQKLANLPTLDLPTDRPRLQASTYRGARQPLFLSKTLTDNLKTLFKQSGVTLFVTLLAAFKTLLYRYTGSEDIPITTPTAGRNFAETEKLIGFFLNLLIIRSSVNGELTFTELLQKTQELTLEAYAHQPLIEPRTNYQILFTLEPPAPNLAGWSASHFDIDTGTSKFDLSLELYETVQGLTGRIEYSSDLFDSATIERMIGHYETLLDAVVKNPDLPLSQLSLLTPPERHQILIEWNNTQQNYPQDKCLHQLFEAQVKRTPDAVAVIDPQTKDNITYKQLNAKANKLAHYLQKLGVKKEVLVGICMERSIQLITAVLAVLKAGGAYVPLDPNYPAERLNLILEDAKVPVLLTKSRIFKERSELSAKVGQIICLDQEEILADESEKNPISGVTLDNLAYVMYTSGSTGTPKGVMALHRCPVNRFYGEIYPLEPNEVCCQKTSLNFVDSLWEIFMPLMHGLPTVIISNEVLKDPPRLIETLAKYHVTRLMLVPSLLRILLDTETNLQNKLPKLKYWFCGGEALATELANRFKQQMPEAILMNLYGLSELWDVTWHQPHQEMNYGAFIPNGKPLSNVQVYLLDKHLQPVPVGVPGEIYVGGHGVSRGYLNRPNLTAKSFIKMEDLGLATSELFPQNSLPNSQSVIYKTGDLGRYLPDGTIEYFGRSDYQVKIRGFRVEIGEIEHLVEQDGRVKQAVVVPVLAEESQRLVAYVVPHSGETISGNKLRRFLKAKLPDYMLPSAFVILKKLPMTPSGKVNRRALPVPVFNNLEREKDFVAPQDEVEKKLKLIWENLLKIRSISIKDNFFEIGGHSLLAVRLFAEIEKKFAKKLPLGTLFEAPTIEQLAQILRSDNKTQCRLLVPIQPEGSKPPLFCIHALGGNVLSYQLLSQYLGKDQPVYGLQARGVDGLELPNSNLQEMAANYIQEIRSVQPQGPYYLAGHSLGGLIAFEMAQQLIREGEKLAFLGLFDSFSRTLLDEEEPPFLEQLSIHWLNLSRKGNKDKIIYIIDRIWWKIEALWEYINKQVYLWRGLPSPSELPEHLTAVIQGNMQAVRSYVPQIYPGSITLFRSLERPTKNSYDPLLGWGDLVAGGMEIVEVPGHHSTMIVEPRVRFLAAAIKNCLEKVEK